MWGRVFGPASFRKPLVDLRFVFWVSGTRNLKFLVRNLLGLRSLLKSRGQLRQDLFALSHSGFKREGFFVEFGATNGVTISNTFLLEKTYGWSGILSEPGKFWWKALNENRACHIDRRAVWATSGEDLFFNETDIPELSYVNTAREIPTPSPERNERCYRVQSISLLDLLTHWNAPKEIDFLSIDTEGSEFEILAPFDFEKYHFRVICVEHNYSSKRAQICELLEAKGYQRVHLRLSHWDDWFVLPRT